MTLGEQIKQARENKNMSQEELAFQLGISRQAVSKWENNLAVPQGINKDMMKQILELDVLENEVVLEKIAIYSLYLGGQFQGCWL